MLADTINATIPIPLIDNFDVPKIELDIPTSSDTTQARADMIMIALVGTVLARHWDGRRLL